MKKLKNRIKGKLISRWRLLQIRIGWNYNIRYMAYLIENYSGHVITKELIMHVQGEHIKSEVLRDDLELLSELPTKEKSKLN